MMNTNKRIVVNFASIGRENYLVGSQRLLDSMDENHVRADLLVCSPNLDAEADYESGGRMVYLRNRYPKSKEYGDCPTHQEAPYAFKAFIIQEALDMGYKKILWADSSCIFLRNLETYWQLSEELGVILLDNPGCPEATWTADDCLQHMGCDPEFAKTFFEIDAFMMLLNFDAIPSIAQTLFDRYFTHSRDSICLKGIQGSLRPDFKAHRHDQSIMSYFAKINNVHPLNYGAWCYAHEAGVHFDPTFIKCGIQQYCNWKLIVSMHQEEKPIKGISFGW